MNYQEILQQTWEKVEKLQGRGKVASYIPELAKVNPDQFGITLKLLSGETYHQNDYQMPFSIQSIRRFILQQLLFRYWVKSCGNE